MRCVRDNSFTGVSSLDEPAETALHDRIMAARKNLIERLTIAPWPVGVIAGLAIFVAIRYGIAAYLGASESRPLSPAAVELPRVLAPMAWALLGLFWFAAALSWLSARRRKQLLRTQRNLDTLANMHCREFESLVGEAFRQRRLPGGTYRTSGDARHILTVGVP